MVTGAVGSAGLMMRQTYPEEELGEETLRIAKLPQNLCPRRYVSPSGEDLGV